MKKNIIFDFGNVLGICYTHLLTKPYVANEEEATLLRDVVFDRLYCDKLDIGAITDEEAKQGMCSRLPQELHQKACRIYDNWVNTMFPSPGMHDVIYDLKKAGKKLYLLSNISVKFSKEYKNIPWIAELFDQFDGLVFSGRIGIVKPDIEIYRYVLNTYHLKAEDCIFIDDSMKNVEGAKAAGIEGYYFDNDVEKLRKHLEI